MNVKNVSLRATNLTLRTINNVHLSKTEGTQERMWKKKRKSRVEGFEARRAGQTRFSCLAESGILAYKARDP